MGNCLQSRHHAANAPDGISRVMSLQSRSHTDHPHDITSMDIDKQQQDSDKSSPSVSQVAPLPVVIQSLSSRSSTNKKHTILQEMQAAAGLSISYNTPTMTGTNTVASTQTYLDTPSNLFGSTPSSAIPSSISHSLPPLTLSSPEILQTIASNSGHSNSTTNDAHITPHTISPQQTPDIDDMNQLDINHEEKNSRQRASSHGSMGIDAAATYKDKAIKSRTIFSLKRLKKKNVFKWSKTPTIKPVADPLNSSPSSTTRKKRCRTYDSPPRTMVFVQTDSNNSQSSRRNDENKSAPRSKKKRARTLGLLHYRSKRKKASASSSGNNHKRVRYKQRTSIQALESCVMEGNVKGVISILSKYEVYYPPFFMDYSNEQGHTLLMKAAFLGHFGLMKYIIQRYNEYRSAVMDSIESPYGRDIALLCLDFMGNYINYESTGGKSALIFACSCKHRCRLNIVKYLLEAGASLAAPRHSKHGKSPLIHAVEWKQQNLIQLLLDYNADVNVQDSNNGFTPLMYAAKFNNRDLCDFLLARNADKTLRNKNGKTAVDLALADQCWASLLALDVTKIPSNVLSIAASLPSKNRWGRYSLSYSYL